MREYIINLQESMAEVFDLEELRSLIFQLNVDWDELPSKAKSSKIFDLIITLSKTGRLTDLVSKLRIERPSGQWVDAPSFEQQINFSQGILLEESTAFDAFSQGVDIMGEIGDQVVDYATGTQSVGDEHRRMIEAQNGLIVNRSYGNVQTITPQEFEDKLEPEDLDYINTFAESMEIHYQQWKKNYLKRSSDSQSSQNNEVQDKLNEVGKEIAKDLGRIVRYLDRLGFILDDHYMRYRDLANRFD